MAIHVTPLGVSYLDSAQLPEVLEDVEGYRPQPYGDSKKIATIGIGIALQTEKLSSAIKTNLALVLRKIGVFEASDAAAPANESPAVKS